MLNCYKPQQPIPLNCFYIFFLNSMMTVEYYVVVITHYSRSKNSRLNVKHKLKIKNHLKEERKKNKKK